jgi:phage protein U
MLYMLGTLTVDTRPFSIDTMERTSDASIVAKPLIGAFPSKEFTGEGEDDITISGEILPFHLGGLNQLETAHAMRRAGTRFPLHRGDGWRPGWYAISKLTEKHTELADNGVGYKVAHVITMVKVNPDSGEGQQIISGLISLFSAFK